MKGDYDCYLAEFKIGTKRNDQSTLFDLILVRFSELDVSYDDLIGDAAIKFI
ncbi:hypothetical protein Pyn_14791 [Prunus yedoensis var. nudiflora]|uniref:Uncharacterized protein n=1 Tax=Prunus yedoensis var. nudiflora TaxID=2094558 RepID=A0A315A4E6_PRUYE|nr:hypothetical protein Pyn_14791 [Prunus yedoensis var. nudiflora]